MIVPGLRIGNKSFHGHDVQSGDSQSDECKVKIDPPSAFLAKLGIGHSSRPMHQVESMKNRFGESRSDIRESKQDVAAAFSEHIPGDLLSRFDGNSCLGHLLPK